MEHYFTKKPTSKLVEHTVHFIALGHTVALTSASGVFSATRFDDGAALLINTAQFEANEKVLDLGCGFGTVGILLKMHYPKINMVMTDINERAVFCSIKNAKKYHLDIDIRQSDGFDALKDVCFDVILFNPPQTAGKKLCLDLIVKCKDHLLKGGRLLMVARHNKGGKSLSEFVFEIFGNMEELSKSKGYRVYVSKNI